MCKYDAEVVVGTPLTIEAGKFYVIKHHGPDLPAEQYRGMIKMLEEKTGANFILLTNNTSIERETNV